jgi:hypothetical protein
MIVTFEKWEDWPSGGIPDAVNRSPWSTQRRLKEGQRDQLLQYFQDNKKRLRLLLDRFRVLEAEAEGLARRPEPELQQPEALYTDAQDIRQLDWYKDPRRGNRWWLEQVIRNTGSTQVQLDTLAAQSSAKVTDFQRLRAATEAEIEQRKTSDKQAETRADQEIQAIYTRMTQNVQGQVVSGEDMENQMSLVRARRDREKAEVQRANAEDDDLLAAYDLRERVEVNSVRFAEDFSGRYTTVIQLCMDFKDNVMGGVPDPLQQMNALYMTLYTLRQRVVEFVGLTRWLAETQRRSVIYEMLEQHFLQNQWTPATLQNHTPMELLPICRDELLGLTNLLARLRQASNDPDLDQAPGYDENPPIPDSPPPPYSLPQNNGNSFWQGNRRKEAKTLLDETYVANGRPTAFTWGWQLRAFFDSPDIFPLCRKVDLSLPKADFIRFVNSLVRTEIPSRMMDAWLIYCTYHNEYFNLGMISNKVTAIDQGWECCYEKSIGGLERNIPLYSYVLPRRNDGPPLERLETLFVENSNLFKLDWIHRFWDIEWLQENTDEFLPSIPKDGGTWEDVYLVEDMEIYLDSWLQRGKFFVREDE